MSEIFRKFANTISTAAGTPWAFIIAAGIIITWIVSGPFFNYSNTWQLVINTTTTIVTFLMVFLIQNAQNRDAKATHLKLDELIRTSNSRNKIIDAEDLSDEELDREKDKIIKKQLVRKKTQASKTKKSMMVNKKQIN